MVHMTSGAPSMVSPAPILQMTTAYWSSSILLTCNRLGLFTAIGGGDASTSELATKLGLSPYPLDNLLDALVALGFLSRQGDRYANSPMARAFLVEGSPAYLGNALRYADDLYPVWGRLGDTLRSGRPALAHEAILGDDPDKTRHFVLGMHNRALGMGRSLASQLDLSGRRRLLDVGGGPATYSCLLAEKNPGLTSRSMDLPAVVAIARTIIADFGKADRVEAIEGDYHQDAYPDGNDVVLCSGMFHRETADSCRAILAKAFRALEPGGMVIVHDVLCNDDRSGPPFALLFGLNMALTANYGTVHSSGDVANWMTECGFKNVRQQPLPPPWPEALVISEKP
jgi:hypothetical protein